MLYKATTATNRLLKLKKRIRAVCGGTAASKTISILLVLIDTAMSSKEPKLISVVSETMPHLKKGAMRDFLNIMQSHNYYKENDWNRTDSIYRFDNGSQIEFFSADSADKVRGPRRDILFINESNNVNYMAYDQLEVRTRETIWLDWNPTNEFWFYTDLLPSREKDIDFITLTYKDNEALDQATVDTIEARKANKNWWKVYGLGQLGDVEGRIYTGWQLIDEVPHEARRVRRWLDFGYSVDPTAIGSIYEYNGGYILEEELYKKGMLNKQIADFILNLPDPHTLIIADSSEPKSIYELTAFGVVVLGAAKGPDSIRKGIETVQSQRISVVKSSTNLIKEYRSYFWKTDRDGKQLKVPEEGLDHHLDGVRYGFEGLTSDNTGKLVIVGMQEGLGRAKIPIYATEGEWNG